MMIRLLLKILVTVSFVIYVSTYAYAESCSSKCTKAGYANSHVDGTAPFCAGSCNDRSGDSWVEPYWANGTGYIYCAGSSSDGKSCLSGSKQCTCWNQIDDCKSQCGDQWREWGDGEYVMTDASCAVRLTNAAGEKVRIIGACGWDGDDEVVKMCYCFYQPEVVPDIPGVDILKGVDIPGD